MVFFSSFVIYCWERGYYLSASHFFHRGHQPGYGLEIGGGTQVCGRVLSVAFPRASRLLMVNTG